MTSEHNDAKRIIPGEYDSENDVAGDTRSNLGEPPVSNVQSENRHVDPTPNPFDNLSALRLDQSYADTVGVKKHLKTVPVRKPDRTWFVRVHPDPNYRLTPAAIIEEKDDREVYLVTPQIALEFPDEFTPVTLFTAINRQGVLFLWQVRLPGLDGKFSQWSRSAMEAAEMAMRVWTRVRANMSLGAYDMVEATGQLSEPEWPDFPFPEILRVGFRDRIVDRTDHPVLQRRLGLV
jgi:hypothetical protein